MKNLNDALFAGLHLDDHDARQYTRFRTLRRTMTGTPDSQERTENLAQIEEWLNISRATLLVQYGGYLEADLTDADLEGFDAAFDAFLASERERSTAAQARRQGWFVRMIVESARELGRTDDLKALITPVAITGQTREALDAFTRAEALQGARRDLLMRVLLDHAGFDGETFETQIRAFWRDPSEACMLAA